MNYCSNCGGSLSLGDRYCKSCGSINKYMVDEFQFTEESKQFCDNCGARTNSRYCSNCGKMSKIVLVKSQGMKLSKMMGGFTNKTSNEKNNERTINFQSFKEMITPDKLKSAGIFTLVMMVITLAFVFIFNGVLTNIVYNSIKETGGLSISELLRLRKSLDFKTETLGILFGASTTWRFSSTNSNYAQIMFSVPYIFLPVTMLIIFISGKLRKLITKTREDISMLILSALGSTIGICLLSMVLRGGRNISDSDFVTEMGVSLYWLEGLKLNSYVNIGSLFMIAFITIVITLLLLTKDNNESMLISNTRKTIISIVCCILIVAIVPTIITVCRLKSTIFTQMGIFDFICFTIVLMGIYIVAIVTGNVNLLSLSNNVRDSEFSSVGLQSSTAKLKYFCDTVNVASKNPLRWIHIVGFLIVMLVVIFIGVKFWNKIKVNNKVAAIITTVMSFGIAGIVYLVGKLSTLSLKIAYKSGGYSMPEKGAIEIGFNASFTDYIKIVIIMAILFSISYIVQVKALEKIKSLLLVSNKAIIGMSTGIILLVSCATVFNVRVSSWVPFFQKVGFEMSSVNDEYFDYDDYYDEYNETVIYEDLNNWVYSLSDFSLNQIVKKISYIMLLQME